MIWFIGIAFQIWFYSLVIRALLKYLKEKQFTAMPKQMLELGKIN